MTPWTAVRQASLSFTVSWSLLKLMSIESVMLSNHLLLCHPLLLLPSIFPSIRVFSNGPSLCVVVYGCFCVTVIDLNRCNRNNLAHEPKIFTNWFFKKFSNHCSNSIINLKIQICMFLCNVLLAVSRTINVYCHMFSETGHGKTTGIKGKWRGRGLHLELIWGTPINFAFLR